MSEVSRPKINGRGEFKPPTQFVNEVRVSDTPQLPATLGYDYLGVVVTEPRNWLAKATQQSFSIRVEKGSGRFVNPRGIFFEEGDVFVDDQPSRNRKYEFKAVSRSVFDKYVKFLQTRDTTFLGMAEREAFDA